MIEDTQELYQKVVAELVYQIHINWLDLSDPIAAREGAANTLAGLMDLSYTPELDDFTVSATTALFAACRQYEILKEESLK